MGTGQNGISHGDEVPSEVCARTGKEGAYKWSDTKLPLTKEAHDKFVREKEDLELKFAGSELIKQGVELILKGFEEEFKINVKGDTNFQDTALRVSRMYSELFGMHRDVDIRIREVLSTQFPSTYQEVVMVKNIDSLGMCSHHLMPVRYKIAVAYMPSKEGTCLGISKLPRLCNLIASTAPSMQEQITDQIASTLFTQLQGCKGSMVHVSGWHGCMSLRGVAQKEALTITSSVTGIFRQKDEQTRSEFLAYLNDNSRQ